MPLDSIGWVGAGLVLLAFFFVETKREKSSSIQFQLINLVGAILLVFDAYRHNAYAFLLLNTVWGLVALYELVKITKKKTKR